MTFVVSGILLGINWFVYIWGVNAGFIVETSLGYFINPLVNVLLGYLILKERLRPGQWLALSIALAGVLYLTCLLYTSDAADERSSVDLGGRRTIQKKKTQ